MLLKSPEISTRVEPARNDDENGLKMAQGMKIYWKLTSHAFMHSLGVQRVSGWARFQEKSWIWTRFGVHAETIQTFPRLYPIFSLSASSWLSFVSGKNVSKKLGFSVHDILTLCTYFFRSLALIPTHVLTVKIHSMESNPLKEILIPNIWSLY